MCFTLCYDRKMYISPAAAQEITELGIRRDVAFSIRKKEICVGNRKGVQWEIVRTATGTWLLSRRLTATPGRSKTPRQTAIDAVTAVEQYARSRGPAVTFAKANVQEFWLSHFHRGDERRPRMMYQGEFEETECPECRVAGFLGNGL